MKLGASQIDITPNIGVELSGFAARVQPSTGLLDPLFAKALYLEDAGDQLLWIHCDLIGLDRGLVLAFREWARQRFGLSEDRIMLSATHTHSGPCTLKLQEAGRYDEAYVAFLQARLREAAEQACAQTGDYELVDVEARVELAVDRRQTASAHTDARVGAVGFCRNDGAFGAVIVNHAMHPVALGSSNRSISADVPGRTALILSRELPGHPVVLVTNGACANLNPPAENVPFRQIEIWGRQIAGAVAARLRKAVPDSSARLRVLSKVIRVPLETLDVAGINAFAEKALQDTASLAQWEDKYRRAVEHWRASLVADAAKGQSPDHRDGELFGLGLGRVFFLGVNAEVFSQFTDWLRHCRQEKIYLIGYANGDMGYLSTRAAYAEGGYEVDTAHMFYGGFRIKPGSLELLLDSAREVLQRCAAPPKVCT